MRLNKIYLMMGLFVTVVFGLTSCGGGGMESSPTSYTNNLGDIIRIISISPTSSVANQVTTFEVNVSYTLTSKDSGLLMLGFNTDQVNSILMISDQEFSVPKGSGTHKYIVSTTPVNWGSNGSFLCYVNLSENPHAISWSALAYDKITIPLSSSAAKTSISRNSLNRCDNEVCF